MADSELVMESIPKGRSSVPFFVLVLSVIQGPDKGKRFELPADEPQLIGRSSEALPMSDTTVSRRHAELTPADGLWYIRDLGSQNGTWVNGVRLSERTRLRPGDQIRCGSTLFVFGATETRDQESVRLVGEKAIDATVERALRSPEMAVIDSSDSVVLAEPAEPRAAAIDHLRVIYRLTTLLTRGVTDRDELLAGVLDVVFEEFRPERGFIVTMDSVTSTGSASKPSLGNYHVAAVKYAVPPKDPSDARIAVSRTIVQHVVNTSEGILSTNAMHDPRFAAGDSVQQMRIRSAICAPVRYRDRMFGAVYIDTTLANYAFTPGQLALLNAIGQHAGLALANQELGMQQLQAQRLAAIGETIAGLSHSIKNILQGLHGGADVVEMGLKRDDLKIAKGGWEILKRNLDRIMSLSLNMLAFSSQRQIEVELVKVGTLIDETIELVQGACNQRRIVVLVDIDKDMPPVPLDAGLMHQALLNLVTNAVEAVEATKGVINIRASYLMGAKAGAAIPGCTAVAELLISDNGQGIAPDKQAWIFEPFNSTKGLKGTGLGLAVTRRVVEDHGGRIEVWSQGHWWTPGLGPAAQKREREQGGGTTFRLLLPADGAIDPSATAASRERSAAERFVRGA